MGYNQGMAVGLAVGIPCFIVFLGTIYFFRRNKRMQRKEDLDATNLDVEMGENGLFEEFGEELHKHADTRALDSRFRPSPEKAKLGLKTALSHPDEVNTTKLSSSSIGSGSKIESDSSKTQLPDHPKAEFQNHDTSFTGRSYASHGKHHSAYDYYDSVIPIMAAPESQNHQNGDKPFSQPPTVAGNVGSSRNSVNSSRGSLSENQTKSLETLAKQLQGPQLHEKLPSRSNTNFTKHNPRFQTHNASKSSSIIDFSTLHEQNGINQHFVNERNFLNPAEMDDPEEVSNHPYRQRLVQNEEYEPVHESVLSNGMGLENNFDNNITADTADSKFALQPDVVFK